MRRSQRSGYEALRPTQMQNVFVITKKHHTNSDKVTGIAANKQLFIAWQEMASTPRPSCCLQALLLVTGCHQPKDNWEEGGELKAEVETFQSHFQEAWKVYPPSFL